MKKKPPETHLFGSCCVWNFISQQASGTALQYVICPINGLVQDGSISSALAVEILQYCTKPSVFLAATKQLYEWYFLSVCPSVCLSARPSVCLSVCPSHLFDYVPIIVSSQNFQELTPRTRVMSMQKVKVRGQRSRSQRSQPNLTVSGL